MAAARVDLVWIQIFAPRLHFPVRLDINILFRVWRSRHSRQSLTLQRLRSFERAHSKRADLAEKFVQRDSRTTIDAFSFSLSLSLSLSASAQCLCCRRSKYLRGDSTVSPFFTNLRKCCQSLHVRVRRQICRNKDFLLPPLLLELFFVVSSAQTTITQGAAGSRDSLVIHESLSTLFPLLNA